MSICDGATVPRAERRRLTWLPSRLGIWSEAWHHVPLGRLLGPALALLALLLLAAAWSAPVWLDEAVTDLHLQYSGLDVLRSIAAGESTPPLFFVIVKAVCSCLGDSPVALRMTSLTAWLFSIWGMYRLVLEVWSEPSLAWFGAAMLAVSPWSLFYAYEARNYELMLALTIWSAFFYRRVFWTGRITTPDLGAFLALTLAGVSCCYHVVFLAVAELAAVLIWVPERRRLAIWSSVALMVAFALLDCPFLCRQTVHSERERIWIPLTGWRTPFETLWETFRDWSWLVGILAVLGWSRVRQRPSVPTAMLVTVTLGALLLPTLAGHFSRLYWPHNQGLLVLPWVVLLVVAPLWSVLKRPGAILLLTVLWAASVNTLVNAVAGDYSSSERQVVDSLAGWVRADDLVLTDCMTIPALNYYLRQRELPLQAIQEQPVADDNPLAPFKPRRVLRVHALLSQIGVDRLLSHDYARHRVIPYREVYDAPRHSFLWALEIFTDPR